MSWMQPGSREFVHLVGRRVGDRIVQESLYTSGESRQRWSFTEIAGSSFVWIGEASYDGGSTWRLEQEMRATRRLGR